MNPAALPGDQEALNKLFREHYAALCFFSERLINDHEAARDIVEDLFIRLWEKQPDFSKYINIKAVLYIGVKNASIDFIRKRRSAATRQSSFSYITRQESTDFILNEITRAEVLKEAYTELQKLPAECRKVMQLYFAEGLDHKAIAARLNVSVSTVKNQKARGIKILRQKLGASFHLLIIACSFP